MGGGETQERKLVDPLHMSQKLTTLNKDKEDFLKLHLTRISMTLFLIINTNSFPTHT